MSITKRLIIQLTLLVAVFWIASATITRYVFTNEIDEVISSDLSKAAFRLMPLVSHVLNSEIESDLDVETHVEPQELDEEVNVLKAGLRGFLAFEARDQNGNILLQSYDAKEYKFPSIERDGYLQEDELFAFTITDQKNGYSLTVVEPGIHRTEAIQEATASLFLPLLLLIPLMIAGILYVVRQATEPVLQLRREIAARGGSNFEPVEKDSQPEELRPIARSVDRLMKRLKTAMDAERIFAANSAHELRTPIAGALAQAQRLKEELPEGKGRTRALEMEATLKRLADFIGKLLQLSRVDSGMGIQEHRENMTPVLKLVMDEFSKKQAITKRIVLENVLNQDLMVAMDVDAFAIAVRNLLENAIIHSTGKSPVKLIVGKDWTIRVINKGKIVAPDKLDNLTDRFIRGESSVEGSGLGLAIVDRIMKQSGGSLTLHSPATGEKDGFEAVLQLP